MTAAGDSLSVARDIVCREPETSLPPRMMCMVIPRAGLRFEYVIVWLGGLITFFQLVTAAAGVAFTRS